MRDLNEDLAYVNEILRRGRTTPVVAIGKIAEHAIDRAIKAEKRMAFLEKRLALTEKSEAYFEEELEATRAENRRLKSVAGFYFENKTGYKGDML